MPSTTARGVARRHARRGVRSSAHPLPKASSGIRGLDEITRGGLPRGRPTLICGGPGCGKTLFAMESLVRGISDYGEPGVFMAFEETAEELAANVASLGFDLRKLEAEKKLVIDYVRVERSEIEETGEYDLEGLFVRIQHAVGEIGAKRVVLDTIESLFAGLPDPAVLRSEIRRLFRWLEDRRLTVLVIALENLERICETHLHGQHRIEVIDVLKNPQLARGDRILALPTLVRKLPQPVKKIIGDPSHEERVLIGLDLRPARAAG